jgi:hypothetical protein
MIAQTVLTWVPLELEDIVNREPVIQHAIKSGQLLCRLYWEGLIVYLCVHLAIFMQFHRGSLPVLNPKADLNLKLDDLEDWIFRFCEFFESVSQSYYKRNKMLYVHFMKGSH